MKLTLWPILLGFVGLLVNTEASSSFTSSLVSSLLKTADVRVRPNADTVLPVVVNVSMLLYSIIDERSDDGFPKARIHIWPNFNWIDPRLSWDPKAHNDIKHVYLLSTDIWLPDITLLNEFEASTKVFHDSTVPINVMVSSDGNCSWTPPTTIITRCDDGQNETSCKFKIYSWMLNGWELDIQPQSAELGLDEFHNTERLTLLSTSIRRDEIFYPCCLPPYPSLLITVTVRRKHE